MRLALLSVLVAAVSQAASAAAPPPAWIGRAVPGPIVKAIEADVLGTSIPEGIAISRAGGPGASYFVGVADSRLDPPEMVMEYELAKFGKGSGVKQLIAGRGRITGAARGEIAIVLRLPGASPPRPSTEVAWILRVDRGSLRLVRRFAADEVVVSGKTVKLTTNGPRVIVSVWRYERGAYRLVVQS